MNERERGAVFITRGRRKRKVKTRNVSPLPRRHVYRAIYILEYYVHITLYTYCKRRY